MKQIANEDEPEFIYGGLMPRAISQAGLVQRRATRVFEAGYLPFHMRTIIDPSAAINPIMGTSKNHLWRQKVACEDEDAFNPETEVKAIPLSYFNSFFAACAVIWVIAIIINCCEKACKYI